VTLELSAEVEHGTIEYQVLDGPGLILTILTLSSGPVGLLLAGCSAVGTMLFGDEIARLFMTDDRIRNICSEHRQHIQQALASGLLPSGALDPVIESVATEPRVRSRTVRTARRRCSRCPTCATSSLERRRSGRPREGARPSATT
jgi:hypothetical protein